jgi:hypothetical protein
MVWGGAQDRRVGRRNGRGNGCVGLQDSRGRGAEGAVLRAAARVGRPCEARRYAPVHGVHDREYKSDASGSSTRSRGERGCSSDAGERARRCTSVWNCFRRAGSQKTQRRLLLSLALPAAGRFFSDFWMSTIAPGSHAPATAASGASRSTDRGVGRHRCWSQKSGWTSAWRPAMGTAANPGVAGVGKPQPPGNKAEGVACDPDRRWGRPSRMRRWWTWGRIGGSLPASATLLSRRCCSRPVACYCCGVATCRLQA